jgi:hypothetical protein
MQTTNTTQPTSTDAIATEAFHQWLQAGKHSGRDQEFWLKAEARLRNGGSTAKATEKKTAATSSSKAKAPAKR